ncbi:glycoside hydrolase [Haloferax sp. DFSO60]|uniref:glycoside hydrolase n=1 Tax=Haloferax sp. DFSO60 TaxID=3388652 RepID=UPI00397A8B59
MTSDVTRRRLLQLGAVGGVAGIAGWSRYNHAGSSLDSWLSESGESILSGAAFDSSADPLDVRGVIYIPSRAFNFYQMWEYYDPIVVERDLSYATRVNLNAVRTWLSYESWEKDPEAYEVALDHFLEAAEDRDLSVLLCLFDAVGVGPTPERLENTDPKTATGLSSPARHILVSPEKWDGPRAFVHWFMDNYRDDDRLLAIEVMNEPGWNEDKKAFAQSMFETLVERRGDIPLTVGSTSLANNAEYGDWGNEILQFHYNFVSDQQTFQAMLDRVRIAQVALDAPIWLTEWQRVRQGRGFTAEPKPEEKGPNYASLAPLIHNAGVGNFFWSLMVKPAWVQPQRKNGVISGLFHEDGSVWSLTDAEAIMAMSGDVSLDFQERQEYPEWMVT